LTVEVAPVSTYITGLVKSFGVVPLVWVDELTRTLAVFLVVNVDTNVVTSVLAGTVTATAFTV